VGTYERAARALALIALSSAACSSRPPRDTSAIAPASASEAPRAPLPPGVLAEARGKLGVVRVEERDGLRLLTIDGHVQGARRVSEEAATGIAADPLVELALGARPGAKTALLIGLGTGRTAAELAKRGVKVEVVEIEPAVVDFAKRFFGFQGDVTVADGAEVLATRKETFDLVLIDASIRPDASSPLLASGPLRDAARRAGEGGVVACRFVGTPAEARDVGKRLDGYVAVFGSGLGDERQNGYVLGAEQPIEVVVTPGTFAFPIALYTSELNVLPHHFATFDASTPAAVPAPRAVQLVGYVVRLREDGSFALDLPHAEMGAVRFVLTGPKARELEAAVARVKAFPTQGDIASDGDTTHTLQSVLGGGGAKRSDLRFSPVIASVKGTARFRAAVDTQGVFDGLRFHPQRGPTGAAREKLLPYGGVLYQLEVEEILWTLDEARWSKAVAASAPRIAAVVRSVREGKLGDAARELDVVASELGSKAPGVTGLPIMNEIRALAQRLGDEAPRWQAAATSLARGAACDRAAGPPSYELGAKKRPHAAVLEALRSCAVREYERALAAGPKDEEARRAAARLDVLYTHMPRAVERRAALHKRIPLDDLPRSDGPPDP
jgi:spermidine synthase